jgi:hemerythrin-like domain-containing protein
MEARKHGKSMETPNGLDDRLTAFGNQLIEVHIWLREELARLREDVDLLLDEGELPRELLAHCLTFCSALTRHHNGEDDGAFPVVAEQFPELRPVLEELERDHEIVAKILRNINALGVVRDNSDPDAAKQVRDELEGLTALLESHFGYEERRIVSALNSLAPTALASTSPAFVR